MKTHIKFFVSTLAAGLLTMQPCFAGTDSARMTVNLNGTWAVAQGGIEEPPDSFDREAPVPGLIDMARPAFDEVGKKSDKRDAFWYKTTFDLEQPLPEAAILKIHKAKYGTMVFLNGKKVGGSVSCFTPIILDVRPYLNEAPGSNVLMIRVGADRESLPAGVPSGWDFEKNRYIPGIYDSVELSLRNTPYIRNIQTIPDIDTGTARFVVELKNGDAPVKTAVSCSIEEASTGKAVGAVETPVLELRAGEERTIEISLPIDNCRLWSPEDPFLYAVTISTGMDSVRVRFGMREFHFDRETGRALLNGKPYYLRGSNVCIYRFFEDAARDGLPWDKEWVRALHKKFKSMHWNTLRYCIGFPPDFWYDIADEEGILIQDEFPIWLLGDAPEDPRAEHIAPQYVEWMRERWNHPCVVIWDAQNESETDQTEIAVAQVRHLDLSNRPWENGWASPQSPRDAVESHPYLFIQTWFGNEPFKLEHIAGRSGVPNLNEAQRRFNVPVIINEYAWLWLNRDGTPTTLTKDVYRTLLGEDSTTAERRLLYTRYLAALTEFWRAHREAAGVLHFCGLGYSRPGFQSRPEGGATSDHFIDLERLELEPNFVEYVKDAFSPVGLMVDFWKSEVEGGSTESVDVHIINDLLEKRSIELKLVLLKGNDIVSRQSQKNVIEPLGKNIVEFSVKMPDTPGDYTIAAQFNDASGEPVRSLRDIKIK
ncbi:MAG: hypothetical protein K9N52_00740 [Verrucomicrobia bacterium]|nr:hypothetical protein [Verrucomicrobiota bacterium]